MGLKLGDVSPLAGMVTGKGALGKLIGQGFGGLIPAAIARDAQKASESEEEQERIRREGYASGTLKMKKGGSVRGNGIAQRGKTKGRYI